MIPLRIWRRRTAGWRMPPNSKFVGRPNIFGNPFEIGTPSGFGFNDGGDPAPMIAKLSREQCLTFYRDAMNGLLCPEMHPHGHTWLEKFRDRVGCLPSEWVRTLRGTNLSCWCTLCAAHEAGKRANIACASCTPCHVDVIFKCLGMTPDDNANSR